MRLDAKDVRHGQVLRPSAPLLDKDMLLDKDPPTSDQGQTMGSPNLVGATVAGRLFICSSIRSVYIH